MGWPLKLNVMDATDLRDKFKERTGGSVVFTDSWGTIFSEEYVEWLEERLTEAYDMIDEMANGKSLLDGK